MSESTNKFNVVIDTNPLYTARAGVANYVRCFLQSLNRLSEPAMNIKELAWEVTNFEYQQPMRGLKTIYREIFWANLIGPRAIRKLNADIFHSTCNVLVRPPKGVRHVSTVYDMATLRHPERYRKWALYSNNYRLKYLKEVDAIICISDFTASEIMDLLHIPSSMITVIPGGSPFHPENGEPGEDKPSFPIPSEFFLFVSSLEPGKNLKLLRDTYLLAESQRTSLPPLLIVGSRWSGVQHEGTPPKNWHYLGHLSRDHLVFLYRRALALLFPSKYEGFGLPVIEAMALGCPVVCSPVASLRQVGGDAALFVAMNPQAYLQAITQLIKDDTLREDLTEKGKEHSYGFSWTRNVEQTVELYRQVLSHG